MLSCFQSHVIRVEEVELVDLNFQDTLSKKSLC